MIFPTKVRGIPCQVEVTYYAPYRPMRITGSGFGDADPPEPEEFEFHLLDRKGYRAKWLECHLSEQDIERLKEDFLDIRLGDYYASLEY